MMQNQQSTLLDKSKLQVSMYVSEIKLRLAVSKKLEQKALRSILHLKQYNISPASIECIIPKAQ